ncbi:MAG: hypothetical protein F6J94_28620 [Moorea sp. SIO1F2]|nr:MULTISPECIES: hypothetical protein [unclassified Moorena]NEN97459.1 hypothetical protein [Moorena sp. SIO3I7]NEO60171.1 hypothetical protein [Moorena sp. SIO4G2]NEQ58473.1 hypothetical protein [Moorena sp. SIO4A1]NEO09995.1 hypothetical protein [Moorena sp. SIO3I8]NEO17197.1 hypothetical protein [Moorena sp. SIO3E8]
MSSPSPIDPQTPSGLAVGHPKRSEFELNLLKQEYFFLQTTVEDYNKQIWVIKALGITATGVVVRMVLKEKQNSIALIGCAIPLFFWILESQWKHFQRGFYPRLVEIEEILTQEFNLRSPAIFTGWSRTFKRSNIPKRQGYLWDGLLNRSVCITYLLEIGFLLVLSLIRF